MFDLQSLECMYILLEGNFPPGGCEIRLPLIVNGPHNNVYFINKNGWMRIVNK